MQAQVWELVRQVAFLAEACASPSEVSVSAFERSPPPLGVVAEDGSVNLVCNAGPSLPDPRLLRRIVRNRQARAKFFGSLPFADPAWDILLDLAAARIERQRVCVTSLCIASGVPPTTALRWIKVLTNAGLLTRVNDETDRRRTFIALSDRAADAMARYFAQIGEGGVQSI
ncbi:winged helix DNA-binding protein [Novosphingobium sp. JCM 18896]|uniref:winged helix DNA-binding protein n=1 Tax=Novosphingobium sp. JCM 18896 TaxID=2989731 RepID=UPI0039B5871E